MKDPDLATAVALHQAGHHAEAESQIRLLLQDHPRLAMAHTVLGNSLKAQGRIAEALQAHLQALEIDPHLVEGWSNLGLVYQAMGSWEEAITCFQQAVLRHTVAATLHHNLANALLMAKRFPEAAQAARLALERQATFVPARLTLAAALREMGHWEEAIEHLRSATKTEPSNADAHFNLALALLYAGHHAEGWEELEWRLRIADLDAAGRDVALPMWQGQAFPHQTLLLRAEQGLGDTLQFVRYAAAARERGSRVIFQGTPQLHRLLQRTAGIDDFVAGTDRAPAADFFAPLFSLPRLCGRGPERMTVPIPYLHPDPERVQHWATALAPQGQLRVGIAWQGNPRYRHDQARSLPLRHFAPLLDQPGLRFFSLQKGPGSEQLASVAGLTDLGAQIDPGNDAFVDTAAVLQHLDLLITSDTALPHLAGGLGRPVWLLLASAPDWRWGPVGTRTPWYPHMRLYRQRTAGDWDGLLREVGDALRSRKKGDGP